MRACEVQQPLADTGVQAGGVRHDVLVQLHALLDKEVEELERLLAVGLHLLSVAHERATTVGGDYLGWQEVCLRPGALASACRTHEHDKVRASEDDLGRS